MYIYTAIKNADEVNYRIKYIAEILFVHIALCQIHRKSFEIVNMLSSKETSYRSCQQNKGFKHFYNTRLYYTLLTKNCKI